MDGGVKVRMAHSISPVATMATGELFKGAHLLSPAKSRRSAPHLDTPKAALHSPGYGATAKDRHGDFSGIRKSYAGWRSAAGSDIPEWGRRPAAQARSGPIVERQPQVRATGKPMPWSKLRLARLVERGW